MAPLVPIVIAFISGILISGWSGFAYPAGHILLAISFLPLVLFFFMRLRFSRVLASIPFVMLGVIFMRPYSVPDLAKEHILSVVREGDALDTQIGSRLHGVLIHAPEAAGDKTRLLLEAKGVLKDGAWRKTSGKVLLTVQGSVEGPGAGDSIEVFARLREPFRFGNPGEFDYHAWLGRQGIYVTGLVKAPEHVMLSGHGGWRLTAAFDVMRSAIRSFIDRSGARHKEPLKALIIGEQRGMERPVKEAFSRTSTTHVLSISGMHVAVVAVFAYALFFNLARKSTRLALDYDIRKAAALFTAVPVIGYGLLAGFPVPAQRAVIMAVVFAISFSLGRGRDFFNTLALSCLIVLALTPYALWDVSFQLTYAAMIGLVYLVPWFNALLSSFMEGAGLSVSIDEKGSLLSLWKRAFASKIVPLIFATIAAGLITAPLIAYHFNRVSLIGALANLAVVPLTSLSVPLLIISSALLPISETLARVPLYAADASFGLAFKAASAFAGLPYASVWTKAPELKWIIAFYIFMLILPRLKDRRFLYAGGVLAVVLGAMSLFPLFKSKAPGTMRVTFISVGQGDSALIEFPDGKTMLVDGGGGRSPDFDIGEKVVTPFLSTRGIDRLDYVVLSHPQLDHMGGLSFVAENFDVGEFWWNGDGNLGSLASLLERRGARVIALEGSKEAAGGGAHVSVMRPVKAAGLDANDRSIVMKVGFGDCTVLFTGDIGRPVEKILAREDIRADVLKVAHHGGRHSSSAEFIASVRPSVAVISVGRFNQFGHPHEETLKRYDEAGVKVYRTDMDGAVTVVSSGGPCTASGHLTQAEQ